MNITVIVIETIILIILFTAAVLFISRNPVDTVYDMPQPIVDRCLELGLIDETKKADNDCIVIDWGWVCYSRKILIPGTEDLTDSYKDYRFHAVGSLKGMALGLPVCALAGLLVQIIHWIMH